MFSSFSYGLSCEEMSDRLFAECSASGCTNILYVKEVHAKLSCSRRSAIITPPDWSSSVIEYEWSQLAGDKKEGIYELTMRIRYWKGEPVFGDTTEYIDIVTAKDKRRSLDKWFTKVLKY